MLFVNPNAYFIRCTTNVIHCTIRGKTHSGKYGGFIEKYYNIKPLFCLTYSVCGQETI
jgi:hypothetical protein